MNMRVLFVSFLLFSAVAAPAQRPAAEPEPRTYDANTSMAFDIARIAESVQTMTRTLKEFVDKFAKVEGISLSEKQQRLVTGMQLLVQAEQRAAVLQKYQIELVEKEAQIRARLAQIDLELNPQLMDRSVAFEGSTQTPEIKENKRRTLMAERASLQAVLQQLQSNLAEAGGSVREAIALVQRLRRAFLPQIERELSDQ